MILVSSALYFQIGWYNEKVSKAFQFNLPDDTLAFVIISTPNMFDKAFKPYVWRLDCIGPGDLLDSCMRHHFTAIHEVSGENPLHNDKSVSTRISCINVNN